MEKFGSHMKAAEAGCPLCKNPLNSMYAEHTEEGWKNRCPKCKGVLEYTVNYETKSIPPVSTKRAEKEVLPPAPPICEDWEFVVNMYEWMTVEGKVVPIKRLPDKELVDSAWALVHANFTKIGSTLAWVKRLPSFGVPYAYPKEGMQADKTTVREKLEEFYESAVERRWITSGDA